MGDDKNIRYELSSRTKESANDLMNFIGDIPGWMLM